MSGQPGTVSDDVHLAGLRRVRAALEAGQVDEARAYLLVNLIATY